MDGFLAPFCRRLHYTHGSVFPGSVQDELGGFSHAFLYARWDKEEESITAGFQNEDGI
jgi:hypothetical protein